MVVAAHNWGALRIRPNLACALVFTPQRTFVLHLDGPDVHLNVINEYPKVAVVSSTLALALYSKRDASEVWLKAVNPATGITYYDNLIHSGAVGAWSTIEMVRVDGATAFGVFSQNSSGTTGNIHVFKATAAGWSLATKTGTGRVDHPTIGSGSGFASFGVYPSSTPMQVWNVNLSDLSHVATSATQSANLSALSHNVIVPFRGGAVVLGKSLTNQGTLGHMYWYKVGVGWVDYVFNAASAFSGNVAKTSPALLECDFGSSHITLQYDTVGDSFSQSAGFRYLADADLDPGDQQFGWNDRNLDPGTDRLLYAIGIWQPADVAGDVANPHKWVLYVANQAGEWRPHFFTYPAISTSPTAESWDIDGRLDCEGDVFAAGLYFEVEDGSASKSIALLVTGALECIVGAPGPPPPPDQSFVASYTINSFTRHVSLTCAGAYTVNWGDGTVENFASSATASHSYDLALSTATVAIGAQVGQTLTDINLGVKHASATLGTNTVWTGPTTSVTENAWQTGWNVVTIKAPWLKTLKFSSVVSGSPVRATVLSSFEFVGPSTVTNFTALFERCGLLTTVIGAEWTTWGTTFTSMFNSCHALASVPLLVTGKGTNFSSMFNACHALASVPLLNTGGGTSFLSMFSDCVALTTVPLFNTAAGTTFQSMFTRCTSLTTVPLFNVAAGTTFLQMFLGCTALSSVPALNAAAGTNFSAMFRGCSVLNSVGLMNTAAGTNFLEMFRDCTSLTTIPLINTAAGTEFSSMFSGCTALTSIPLLVTSGVVSITGFNLMFSGCTALATGAMSGTARNISYHSCNLNAAALDSVYTNLATVPVSPLRTITVTGNPGVSGDDPSIATAKGWAVSGS